MSKLKRDNLNSKIGLALEIFEKTNFVLEDYDFKFYEYYEDIRNNFIVILNEIVENYSYKVNNNKTSDENILKLRNDYKE